MAPLWWFFETEWLPRGDCCVRHNIKTNNIDNDIMHYLRDYGQLKKIKTDRFSTVCKCPTQHINGYKTCKRQKYRISWYEVTKSAMNKWSVKEKDNKGLFSLWRALEVKGTLSFSEISQSTTRTKNSRMLTFVPHFDHKSMFLVRIVLKKCTCYLIFICTSLCAC